MLGVMLNESELVDKYLSENAIDSNPMISIGLLIKYYYLKEMNEEKIYSQIMEYLTNVYKDKFIITKWDVVVRNAIKKFYTDMRKYRIDIKMNNISEIQITQGELNNISSLNDLILEKLAFVMLVYAKISNIQMNNNEGWINKTSSMICKEAKVSLRGIEKERIFNKLYKLQYIKMSNNNSKTNMKINYFDEDSESILKIDDFNGVIYSYLIWKGEKWRKCENCNKYIKIKNNKIKYCGKCKKEMEKKWDRENKRKNRIKSDLS